MTDSQVCPVCKGAKFIVTETPTGKFEHGCNKCRATGIVWVVRNIVKGSN